MSRDPRIDPKAGDRLAANDITIEVVRGAPSVTYRMFGPRSGFLNVVESLAEYRVTVASAVVVTVAP